MVNENGGNVSKAMRQVGYSPHVARTPKSLTESDGWKELTKKYLPDEMLMKKHTELMNSSRMDHMVFPLGPKDEDDINFSGAKIEREEEDDEDELDEDADEEFVERTTLTDKEIIEMLAEVNCKVRRIVHGNTARHVYFWSADNTARDKALDKAYKIKGYYPKEGGVTAVQVNIGDKIKEMRNEFN